jgi:hypothetical protein
LKMQTIGFKSFNNREDSSNSSQSMYARTNYAIKEEVGKNWKYYQLNGTCEVKPYPVFVDGRACPSRLTAAIESHGTIDINAMTDADKMNYAAEVIPPAFLYLPCGIVSYAGTGNDHYTFVNYVSDADKYDMTMTPYDVFWRTLYRKTPKKDEAVGAEHSMTLTRAKNAGTLSIPRETLLFRGAILKHKGEHMNTKNSVNGMLPKGIFAISQKSAISAFMRAYLEQQDIMQPLSATNCKMSLMLPLQGTTMVFSKLDPNNRNSDYLINPRYDAATNSAIASTWEASNETAYLTNIYQSYGAAQSMMDIIDILTAEQMVDIMAKAFPHSWLWYGLRDSAYAQLVRQYEAEAVYDAELTNLFNPGATPAVPSAPALNLPVQSPVQTMPTIKDLPQDEVPMYNEPINRVIPLDVPDNKIVPMSVPPVSSDQAKADATVANLKNMFGGN